MAPTAKSREQWWVLQRVRLKRAKARKEPPDATQLAALDAELQRVRALQGRTLTLRGKQPFTGELFWVGISHFAFRIPASRYGSACAAPKA